MFSLLKLEIHDDNKLDVSKPPTLHQLLTVVKEKYWNEIGKEESNHQNQKWLISWAEKRWGYDYYYKTSCTNNFFSKKGKYYWRAQKSNVHCDSNNKRRVKDWSAVSKRIRVSISQYSLIVDKTKISRIYPFAEEVYEWNPTRYVMHAPCKGEQRCWQGKQLNWY